MLYLCVLQVYEPCFQSDEPYVDRCKWTPPLTTVPVEKLPEDTRRALLAYLGEERGRMLLAERES